MIDPKYQWAIQIDVTNACTRQCSNCTRFVGHKTPFLMTPKDFYNATMALKDFPSDSPPSPHVSVTNKVVGMLGGEPLLHPDFEELCEIMADVIPEKKHRGLWTGLNWQRTRYAGEIEATFGYINNNKHDGEVRHSPILVAIDDVVQDENERRRLIEDCWLQRMWSGSITPKGFFHCEVAAAFDELFDGPGGLPIEPGCWQRPLSDFQDQIDRWCHRCGIPLNLKGRIDSENRDDISSTNLEALGNSLRIVTGCYVLYKGKQETTKNPWKYMQ